MQPVTMRYGAKPKTVIVLIIIDATDNCKMLWVIAEMAPMVGIPIFLVLSKKYVIVNAIIVGINE